MAQTVRWRVVADAAAVAEEGACVVLAAAQAAVAARGVFHLVLCGGETPRALYRRLAAAGGDWPRWQVWFGDERCLPAGDAGRNDAMAGEAWLGRVAVPPANVHAIPAELGPEAGAARYAGQLAGVGEFDLVLLGLGEDGHTASLFPGHPAGAGAAAPDVLAVRNAPKPPPKRVSLSAARLGRARKVLFLVSGAGKRTAVAAWRRGDDLPARWIAPPTGVEVLLDAAAQG